MNLDNLVALLNERNSQDDEAVKSMGGLGSYNQGLHVNVLPIDFERLIDQKCPDRQWATPGGKPHIQARFAMWYQKRGYLTASCTHDYLVE